jgi:heme/copper-type cytochrome/quinol oxidase subunit 4
MTTAAQDQSPAQSPARARAARLRQAAAIFLALGALTALELRVAQLPVDGARRATTLVALLIGKVGLVMHFCLRAHLRRRSAPRLAAVALVLAATFAVVLMLEASFQAGVR